MSNRNRTHPRRDDDNLDEEEVRRIGSTHLELPSEYISFGTDTLVCRFRGFESRPPFREILKFDQVPDLGERSLDNGGFDNVVSSDRGGHVEYVRV